MQKRRKRIFWGNDLEYQAALIVRSELEEYQKILDELRKAELNLKITKSLINCGYRKKIDECKGNALISSRKKRLRDFRKRKISLHRLYLESSENAKNAKM